MREIIICAAVQFEENIWYGHRHHHAIEAMKDKLSYSMNRKEMDEAHVGENQGFITNTGRFVDRIDAYKIAIKYKPEIEEQGKTMLYSEDIY